MKDGKNYTILLLVFKNLSVIQISNVSISVVDDIWKSKKNKPLPLAPLTGEFRQYTDVKKLDNYYLINISY